jgi:SAM-dependent methyltransferase
MKCYLCDRQELIQLTTQLRNGPGVVLYCDHCGLGMLQHNVSDLNRFYKEEYRKQYGPEPGKASHYAEIFDSYVNYQQQRVDLLRPYFSLDKKLLEVGCSTGHFLYNVKNLVGEVIGVDYDSGAAEFAGNICQCKTFGCGLDETGLPVASYDVACAIHTMEHVEDPIGFATMLGKYLKPDGIIVIEVPSLHDPLLWVYDNANYRIFWFRDVHLFYFTPKSLEKVMNKAGFIGKMYFTQDYNFLNHLSWIMLGKPQSTCHYGLSTPKLPIAERVSTELREELDSWMESVDREYKALLAKHEVTSNITFIGRRV